MGREMERTIVVVNNKKEEKEFYKKCKLNCVFYAKRSINGENIYPTYFSFIKVNSDMMAMWDESIENLIKFNNITESPLIKSINEFLNDERKLSA